MPNAAKEIAAPEFDFIVWSFYDWAESWQPWAAFNNREQAEKAADNEFCNTASKTKWQVLAQGRNPNAEDA